MGFSSLQTEIIFWIWIRNISRTYNSTWPFLGVLWSLYFFEIGLHFKKVIRRKIDLCAFSGVQNYSNTYHNVSSWRKPIKWITAGLTASNTSLCWKTSLEHMRRKTSIPGKLICTFPNLYCTVQFYCSSARSLGNRFLS